MKCNFRKTITRALASTVLGGAILLSQRMDVKADWCYDVIPNVQLHASGYAYDYVGNWMIHESGCTIISLLNARKAITNLPADRNLVLQVAREAYWNQDFNYYAAGGYSYLYKKFSGKYDVAFSNYYDTDRYSGDWRLIRHLRSGGAAIVSTSDMPGRGHAMAVAGYNAANNTYKLLDSSPGGGGRQTTFNGDWKTLEEIDNMCYPGFNGRDYVLASKPYRATTSSNGHGNVYINTYKKYSPNCNSVYSHVPEEVVPADDIVNYEVTADNGYHIERATVNGKDVPLELHGSIYCYTCDMPYSDMNMNVTFAPNKYRLTRSISGQGTVYFDDYGTSRNQQYNSKFNLYVAPSPGYYVKSITVNGKAVKIQDNGCGSKYSIKMPGQDTNVAVTFAKYKKYDKIKSFVTGLYKNLHNREPDAEGLEFWTTMLASKTYPARNVVDVFINSSEFVNRKLNNKQFATAIYKGMLSRNPDAGGLDYWVSQLNAGMSRVEVVYRFADGCEFNSIASNLGIAQ